MKIGKIKDYIFEEQDIRCCFCNKLLIREEATFEHIIPRSRNVYCLNNLAISCKVCNHDRVTADFHEFRKYIQGITDEPPINSKVFIRRNRIAHLVDLFDNIVKMFVDGITIENISNEFGLNKKTVKRILREKKMISSVGLKLP